MVTELDNTEKKIVDATFKILQKESVEKTTTKKIASEAGVNEVTIFRKFKHKDSLIELTKEYYMDILLKKLEEIFAFEGDEEIGEYLNNNFIGSLNLPEENLSIINIFTFYLNQFYFCIIIIIIIILISFWNLMDYILIY